MHGGLPPPQPLSLYEEKENCGESSAHPVPLGEGVCIPPPWLCLCSMIQTLGPADSSLPV